MELKRFGGNIPVLQVKSMTIPEAWEKAVLAVWEQGIDIRTEYDAKDEKGKFIHPPSKDATVTVVVHDPFAEPRIHKNIPGGPEELEVYRQEIVYGIHDHWIDPSDPDKWTYTYHGRLEEYEPSSNLDDPDAILKVIEDGKPVDIKPTNQLEYMVNKLSSSFFSRRAQATSWMPTADPQTDDSPCLQRLWCRILPDEQGNLVINANSHWRSRDLYKAWFMNAFVITDLVKSSIADRIAEKIGKPVRIGRYVDISDSLHIYGSYFKEIEPEINKMKANPDYRERAWNSDHPPLVAMFEETRKKLSENPDYQKKGDLK